MTFAPTTAQLEDAQKLTADGMVDLFEITLTNASKLYMSPGDAYTWQGHDYESIPCKLTGYDRNSGEEASRPTFRVANPDGLFTGLISQGVVDNATVTRRRILRTDLLANSNTAISRSWRVKRVSSVNRDGISLELRDQLDGQFFQVPGRMYIPPEFNAVKLG